MPPHWQMIATDDDTWAWPIGQIEIQDDPAYPSYVTEVWTSMNTKQIVEVLDRRYPDFSRVLIIEYAAVPDPFKDHWTVYLLNDKKSIDLKLSGTASIELRNLYQNAENGTAKTSNEIEENAVEYKASPEWKHRSGAAKEDVLLTSFDMLKEDVFQNRDALEAF